MDVAFATDSSTAGALSSAFPQLDLSAFGFASSAPGDGAGDAFPLAGAFDDAVDHDTFEEDDRMPVDHEHDGVSRGMEHHGTDRFDESADADQIPLGPNGTPGQASVFLSAEDVHVSGAEGEQDAAVGLRSAVGADLPESPEAVVVPELPSEGACLRATHLRSEMPSDAGLDAVQTACRGLGHVVSGVMPSATVLCTTVDETTGAPVDYSVQIFTQCGRDGLVMEVQHAGRGDRLAFNAVYASVAEQLRAEAGCGVAAEADTTPRTPVEPLGPPRALSSRAATLGAVSAPLASPSRLGEAEARPASADAAVPGADGLRLLARRLRSASSSSDGDDSRPAAATVPDASESAETAASIADRLVSMDTAALAATVAALDSAALPAALVSVLRAAAASAEAEAAASSLAADDSTVIPALVAIRRLLACPGQGCSSLTGSGPAALAALRALAQTAKAASLQHEDASRDLAAASASRRSAALDDLHSAPVPLSDAAPLAPSGSCGPLLAAAGDGPAAATAPWLASSGAVLRLRATAAALRAAASRPGAAPEGASPSGKPGAPWAAVVAEAAADGIASLVSAAALLGDEELSDAANWLQSAGRR